jgi:hypothetical protein
LLELAQGWALEPSTFYRQIYLGYSYIQLMSALSQYVRHDGHDVGKWIPGYYSTLGFTLVLTNNDADSYCSEYGKYKSKYYSLIS